MEKAIVDEIITKYIKKIYSFSLSKTLNIDKAEELSSRITFEIYKTLLKKESVYDVNSYIFRVARNVCSRFLTEEKNNASGFLLENEPEKESETDDDLVYARLRKEISYLNQLQREIIVKHYFYKLKQNEIAKELNISLARVKWHLYEAKNQLKEGFKEEDNIKYRDVKLTNLMHLGYPGKLQNIVSFFISKNLTQSIVYSAYYKAKTAKEIAREISVPLSFVEDEISYLLDYGFLDKQKNNKFLTNMYIIDVNKERTEKIESVLKKYAKIVCDTYIPLILNSSFYKACLVSIPSIVPIDNSPNGADSINASLRSSNLQTTISSNIHFPENDLNFFMWSIISFATFKKLNVKNPLQDIAKYFVKRKDGGQNIAIARVDDKEKNKKIGYTFEASNYPTKTLQFCTKYDNRQGINIEYSEVENQLLYKFMTGELKKESENINEFMRLYERGYISSNDFVNMIVTTLSIDELSDLLPDMPKELKKLYDKLDNEIYLINKPYFPVHKHNLCRVMNKNNFSNVRMRECILEILLEKGVLQPLKEHQKSTVNMIMFSDVLPS